ASGRRTLPNAAPSSSSSSRRTPATGKRTSRRRIKMKKVAIVFALVSVGAVSLRAATYEIDPNHSSVAFTVRHLVTKVHGTFDKFSGTFVYDEKAPKKSKAEVKIDPASIDTHVQMRDNDLRSASYFDTAKCADMAFKSTKVELSGGKGKLFGDL